MSNWQIVVLLLVLIVLLFVGPTIGRYADNAIVYGESQFREIISDTGDRVHLAPALMWLAWLLLRSVGRTRGAWDSHESYFLCAGMFFWVLVAFYPLHHPDILQLKYWRILTDGWIGISFIALGLYEHMTLVRLVPKKAPHETDNGI